jgi:hypothetical protein
VARIIFDKAYKVGSDFDFRDLGWWDVREFRTGDDDYSKAVALVSNGRFVLTGDFQADPEGDYGRIARMVFRDDDGTVVTIDNVGRDISQLYSTITDNLGAVSRAEAARMLDHVVARVSRIDLGDRGDRPDDDWLTDISGMVVRGHDGRDTISGSDGNDRIKGNDGHDAIDGRRGDDAIQGSRGDDDIEGGAGRDRLKGGSGEDVLDGGRDKDVLSGGSGADTFHFTRGDGKGDRITDFRDGKDLIWIGKGAQEFDDLTLRQRGEVAVVRYGEDSIRVEDTDIADLTAADFLF